MGIILKLLKAVLRSNLDDEAMVVEEIHNPNTDHLVLHMRSVNLLRDVIAKLDAEFRKNVGVSLLKEDRPLHVFVGYILIIAIGDGAG
jgi:hypothetical protein